MTERALGAAEVGPDDLEIELRQVVTPSGPVRLEQKEISDLL